MGNEADIYKGEMKGKGTRKAGGMQGKRRDMKDSAGEMN